MPCRRVPLRRWDDACPNLMKPFEQLPWLAFLIDSEQPPQRILFLHPTVLRNLRDREARIVELKRDVVDHLGLRAPHDLENVVGVNARGEQALERWASRRLRVIVTKSLRLFNRLLDP